MFPSSGYFHFLYANDENWTEKFHISKLPNITGEWSVEEEGEPQAVPGEKMFFIKLPKAYYGASTKFASPLRLKDETLALQLEVRFQESIECAGAYIKLFSNENYFPDEVSNETKYSIMFGPDKCGSTDKVHFIFRHRNPLSGVIEEKHMKDPPKVKSDKVNHIYTLIVRPDNTFEVMIDTESVKQGTLFTDFSPSVIPPKLVDDPTDTKPDDWVDEENIPDPDAVKPEDWDEDAPEYIPDPEKAEAPEGWLVDEEKYVIDPDATKPEDWDDDTHGEWEAPTIENPKCKAAPGCGKYESPLIKNEKFKGKWQPPQIPNPAYKGTWKPRQIPNPYYYEDKKPHNFLPIAGIGFDLWAVNKMIGINNIFIGTDENALMRWNKDNFIPKHKKQEAIQKKNETSTATKKEIGGLAAKVIKFYKKVVDAYKRIYVDDKVRTIALSAVAGVIPIILFVLSCVCVKPNVTPEPVKTPQPQVKKQEEVQVPKPDESHDGGKENTEAIEKRTPTESSINDDNI